MEKYIDLHLHLDGAITMEIARELALLQDIPLPSTDDSELRDLLSVTESCRDLNDFLKCFDLPLTLLQTKQGLCQAVRLVQENIKAQGVAYAEIRFAPQLHCQKGLSQQEAIEAALEGLGQSRLPCNLILCCMRGSGRENDETLELARQYLVEDGGVVALDLAGAEGLFPTKDYIALFERARRYGIPFTIHAGEADGATSVRDALAMGASRIGHGVRGIEDPAVMEYLAKNHIPLEMCPTSNRQTRAVADMSQYPLKKYLDAGIPVTINTDDMAISRTTLAMEFQYAQSLLGLSETDIRRLKRNAVNAAFTSDKTKRELLAMC